MVRRDATDDKDPQGQEPAGARRSRPVGVSPAPVAAKRRVAGPRRQRETGPAERGITSPSGGMSRAAQSKHSQMGAGRESEGAVVPKSGARASLTNVATNNAAGGKRPCRPIPGACVMPRTFLIT